MKQTSLFWVLAFCLLPFWGLAQNHATIQVGDTNYSESVSNLVPMGSGYGNSYVQIIYTPEQIGASGDIDTLWFYCMTPATLASTKIYMGHTELEPGRLGVSSWVDSSSLRMVGHFLNVVPSLGNWYPFALDSSFHYDGRRNLAVAVSHSGGVSYNCLWSTFRTPYAQTILRGGTGEYSSLFPGNAYGTLKTDFPRTRFSMGNPSAICPRPSLVRMLSGNPTSVALGWSGSSEAETYEYELRSCDGCWDETSTTHLYDTVEYFSNLSPDTLYYFRVRAVCSPDYSAVSGWRYYPFKTPCSVADVPFHESFEQWSSPHNDCFHVGHNSGTSNPSVSISSSIYSDSSRSLLMSAGEDYALWLALPQLSSQPDFLQISFDLYQTENSSWPIPLMIGVMSDAEDLATFDTVVSLYPDRRNHWQHYEIPLQGYAGQGNRIAFLIPQGASKSYYLDNILVDYVEYCARPIGLYVDAMAGSQATIRWKNTYNNSFAGRYGEMGCDTPTLVPSFMGDSLVIADLLPGRAYFVQIETACGDDALGWSDSLCFRTPCFAPVQVGNGSYLERFEGYYGTPYTSNEYNTLYARYNQQPYCWDFYGNGMPDSTNTNFLPRIYRGSDVVSPNADDNCLSLVSMNYSGSSQQYLGYAEDCGDTNYAVMPVVQDSLPRLSLSFAATMEGGDTLTFGLWRNDSVFVPLEKYRGSRLDTTVALNRYDSIILYGDRLAFRWVARPSSATSPRACCIDDILLETTGNCIPPLYPSLVSQSSQGTVLNWVIPYDGGHYEVRWGLSPSVYAATGDTVVEGSFVILQGLLNGADYHAWVRTLCDSSHSIWSAFAPFTTQCDTITAYPYFEHFDNYVAGTSGTLNPCWELSATSSSATGPMASTEHAVSAPNSLRLSAPNNSGYSRVILPFFDRPYPELQLSFDLYNSGTGETRLELGTRKQISYNEYQQNAYDTVRMDYVPAGEWMHVVIPMDHYLSDGHLYLSNSRANEPVISLQNIYIDNLKIDLMPDCVLPRKPKCDSVTANAAYLHWQGSASQYRVAFSEDPYFLPDTCTRFDTCPGNTFLLPNLMPSTTYYFRVQSLCQGSANEWSVGNTFTTTFGCASGTMSQSVFASPCNGYSSSGNTLPLGTNNTSFATAASWQIVDANELLEHHLPGGELNSLSLQYVSNTPITIGVNVYLMETSLTQLTIPDTVPLSSMTRVFHGNVAFSSANEWTEIRFDTPFSFTGESNLLVAFERTSVCSSQGNFNMAYDTVHYSIVRRQSSFTQTQRQRLNFRSLMRFSSCADDSECPLPTDLLASDVTHNEAVLHWNASHDSVDVLYGPQGHSYTLRTELPVVGDSVLITGLNENTDYYFYVRDHCGETSQSRWSAPCAFHTDFAPLPLPYFEDFDSSQVKYAFSSFPSDWDKFNGSSAYYINPNAYIDTLPSTFDYSGAYMHYLCKNNIYFYTVMPYLDGRIDTLSLSFIYRYTHDVSTNTVFEIGLVHRDSNDYTILDTVPYSQALGYYTYDFGQSGMEGRNFRIFFRIRSTATFGGFLMDDLRVNYRGGCAPVRDVELDWVSDQSAQVSWQGNAGSYCVRYSATPDNDASWITDTVTTPSITLTQLSSNTPYRLNIQALCPEGAQMEVPYTFRTECGAYSVPFIPNLTENNPNLPSCWTFVKNSIIGWTVYSNMPGSLAYFPASPFGDWAISPKIQFSGTEKLTFVLKRTSGTNETHKARVRVFAASFDSVTQAVDPSAFQSMGPLYESTNTTTGDTIVIDLSGYTGLTSFAFVADTSTMGIGISDVRVESFACPAPAIESVSTTPVSALVKWEEGLVAQGQWSVQNANLWCDTLDFDAATDSLLIEGLEQGSDYEFRLRTICANGLTSDWTTVSFSTLPIENCYAPRLTLSDYDYTTATVVWEDSVHSQWIVRIWNNTYEHRDTLSLPSTTFERLTPSLCYHVALQSFCGYGYLSEWGDTLDVCMPSCDSVSQVEVSVTGNDALVTWQTEEEGSDQWQVAYGARGFIRDEGFHSDILDANSYLIEDLTPGNEYDVYVRSVCDEGIYSVWSHVVSFTIDPVGITGPQASEGDVRLFPNPAHGSVAISVEGIPIQALTLFDVTGRALRSHTFPVPTHHATLNLDGIPASACFLRITRNDRSEVYRLIVK